MKLGLTAKALALAVAVGVSSQAMATTTNGWWNIDFEDATTISALTNETAYSGIGQWTTADGDESTIATNNTTYLKLDTQGTDLVWTPDVPSTSTVVLVDADIYLVGSDSEPTGFDEDTGNPVQTAVYLKNYIDETSNITTSSVLCAYVADTQTANKWIEFSNGSMIDTNWYSITIEVDYSGDDPAARYYVDDVQMVDGATEGFLIANYTDFSTASLQKVNSVSFRGTGALDNFVGQQVVPEQTLQLTFTVKSYTDNVQDGSANIAASSGATVTAGDSYFVTFNEFDAATQTKSLALVRVYTNATEYVDYAVNYDGQTWTYDSPLYYDSANWGVRLDIDTTGMTEGYTIEGYFGDVPSGGDPTTPEIGGGGDLQGAAPVEFEMIGDPAAEYFCVSFVAAESGVTYTLQTVATLDATFADETDALASATSSAANEVITLKAPTGSATTKFFRVKASN